MGYLSLLRNSLVNLRRRRRETAAAWSPISASGLRHQRYRFSSSSNLAPKLPILLFPAGETVDHEYNNEKKMLKKFRTFSPITNEFMYQSAAVTEEISNAYCAGSSRGWLAFISRIDCRFYLANIFSSPSSPTIVPLPPIETLPHVDFNGKVFKVHNRDSYWCELEPALMSEIAIEKVSITSDPTDTDTDCIVMISFGLVDDLAFCRIGDTSWTVLERQPGCDSFHDFVYCQKDKLFYALTDCFHIEAFDLITKPSSPTRFDCPVKYAEEASEYGHQIFDGKCVECNTYLVESPQGDMLRVSRYFVSVAEDGSLLGDDGDDEYTTYLAHRYRSVYFHVYKLDFQKQTGQVDHLDDTALFVGLNESFSLSVPDYPQLTSNSIYFADDLLSVIHDQSEDYPYGGHDFGVYNHKEESVSPLYQPFQFIKFLPPPFWVSRA